MVELYALLFMMFYIIACEILILIVLNLKSLVVEIGLKYLSASSVSYAFILLFLPGP